MLKIYKNPNRAQLNEFVKEYPVIDSAIVSRIENQNLRIEFFKHDDYLFLVYYLPEYRTTTRTIESVEVNLFYDKKSRNIVVFAHHTEYFFEKYYDALIAIPTDNFSIFIESLLDVVLEDESRIVEHILHDTNNIHTEYTKNHDPTALIRHLTNNLINISSLKLIVDNQNKLLEETEGYIKNYEESPVNYKRAYIGEELNYVKDFCRTLLDSINTKYQVKVSDNLYSYTRYTFVIFLAGIVIESVLLFRGDTSPYRMTFWICVGLTALGSYVMFKKFK